MKYWIQKHVPATNSAPRTTSNPVTEIDNLDDFLEAVDPYSNENKGLNIFGHREDNPVRLIDYGYIDKSGKRVSASVQVARDYHKE